MELEELIKLYAEQGKAFEEFKKANDARLKAIEKNGEAPAELIGKVDTINEDLTRISAEMKAVELQNKELERKNTELEMKANRPAAGIEIITPEKIEHKAAFDRYLRKGEETGLRELETKAFNIGVDPEGGYFALDEMSSRIGQIVTDTVAMRGLADVITIGGRSWTEVEETSDMTVQWLGEKTDPSDTTIPATAEIEIVPGTMAVMPKATQQGLDDSVINVEQWLANKAGRAFAMGEGTAFITGNGVVRPRGIAAYTFVANASYVWGSVGYIASGKAGAWAESKPQNKLFDLQHALKQGYRVGASWLMNDATLNTIRQFQDGLGNYLWRPGLELGKPETLLGKPVAIDDNVADVASDSYSVFFADFMESYTIVDRLGVTVLRDPFSDKPYVIFFTTKRVGGGIRNFAAIKAMKFATS